MPSVDACPGTSVLLEPSYDPVRRRVTYRQNKESRLLTAGQRYQLTVYSPTSSAQTGLRAFDGTELETPYSLEFAVVAGGELDQPAGDPFCEGPLPRSCDLACDADPTVAACQAKCFANAPCREACRASCVVLCPRGDACTQGCTTDAGVVACELGCEGDATCAQRCRSACETSCSGKCEASCLATGAAQTCATSNGCSLDDAACAVQCVGACLGSCATCEGQCAADEAVTACQKACGSNGSCSTACLSACTVRCTRPVAQIFQGCNGGSGCHITQPTAMGLDLSSPDRLQATAIGHVAHETMTGEQAAQADENPPRFGRAMPLLDPQAPGNSYLLYKLLASGNDHLDSPASDAEIGRLRASVVVGMPMPPADQPGAFLRTGEVELISRWLELGAATPVCK